MIEYVHNRVTTHELDATLAIHLPTKTDLNNLFLSHANQILLPVGITRKHPNDVYSKKLAREYAIKNMTNVPCDLILISQKGTKHLYNFETEVNGYHINFTLTTVAESENVRLITGWINTYGF
jgi:hypothetical protein